MSKRIKDLKGQKFGRLTVLQFDHFNKWHYGVWLCLCDCGTERIVTGGNLRSGNTKSCGCYLRESMQQRAYVHGHASENKVSPTYRSWASMISRCTEPNRHNYKHYGGRGIQVCERWLNSFENFLKDMGERPKGTMLERSKNDGNYEPDNCIWATIQDQARNRRNTHQITYQGESRCIKDWSEVLKLNYGTLIARLKRGWTIEEAFTRPIAK